MKRRESVMIAMCLLAVVALLFFLTSVSMVGQDVFGGNITNDSTLAKVYVWNTEPNIYRVTITPSTVDLSPGNTTIVNCTGYAWDYNGWQDIVFLNATLYNNVTSSNGAADDNNDHYTNSSCSCAQLGGSDTNVSCTCLFPVWYYATNGTWICNVTVRDSGGNATEREYNFTTSNDSSTQINKIIAINTQQEIDYGNLSVTETSSMISANVTNWGNVPINVSVYGFGGTNESIPNVGNLSMICELGNISVGYQRYSINSTADFSEMVNLTYNNTGVVNLSLPTRINDTGYESDSNFTYWKLEVPPSVGGYCNGTVVFTATEIGT